jgi:hypothetical protein
MEAIVPEPCRVLVAMSDGSYHLFKLPYGTPTERTLWLFWRFKTHEELQKLVIDANCEMRSNQNAALYEHKLQMYGWNYQARGY